MARFAVLTVLTLIATGAIQSQPPVPANTAKEKSEPCFRCTLVIGYSQVGQRNPQGGGWYVASGEFEKAAGAERWELTWQGGAGVDRWQNPDYPGWRQPIQFAVPKDPDKPDRILLSVSGPYGNDEAAWAKAINTTVNTI
jgi:hypothetical protein